MSAEQRAPLIARMRSWCGMLNWLSLGTRPDVTTVCSLLASSQCCPSPGHLDAAKYVGKYLKATASLGLLYSSRSNSQLEGFVYFPTPNKDLSGNNLSLLPLLMPIGARRTPLNRLLNSPVKFLSTKQSPSVAIFFFMGGIRSFGQATKSNAPVAVHAKPKSKPPIRVRSRFSGFATFCLI